MRPAARRAPTNSRRRIRVLAVTVAAVAIILPACAGGPSAKRTSTAAPNTAIPTESITPAPYSRRPNIVFVLTDDLSMDLVRFMPHVIGLMQSGMTFSQFTVTDSLCCPSRASILTGMYPHDTGVFTNDPVDGGFGVFHARGLETQTFAERLQQGGYRTALMGKYLNGYQVGGRATSVPPDYVPPGWTEWAAAANGYHEFDYLLNHNHSLAKHGHAADDYLTSVIQKLGTEFIERSVLQKKPFLLEMSTFAPHSPYTPAEQDSASFLDLRAPRGPSFGVRPTDAPAWQRALPKLTLTDLAHIDRAYIKRVQSVQSIDRMVAALETTLQRTGQADNTYFVFSSDNGYHMGQHGFGRGKLTAFDTDIHVPLVVSGPGIAPDTTSDSVVENVDLAPTFQEWAGVPTPSEVDGRSLVPLLLRRDVPWRSYALVEHHGPVYGVKDPDDDDKTSPVLFNPPTYDALRTRDWTYVRYFDGEREYYDRRADPAENHNLAPTLSPARVAELNATLAALAGCHGGTACWTAARPGLER